MTNQQETKLHPILKTIVIFSSLLLLGSTLIYFGTRNDAVSVAKSLKTGVLTADTVNVAFENVGGKLMERKVEESQMVEKGDILMILDDEDSNVAIDRLKAVIRGQEALIRNEKSAINIAISEVNLAEVSSWRKIEEIEATLSAARDSQHLAQIDYDRAQTLRESGGVSQSVFDNARNSLAKAQSAVVQAERQLASVTIGATEEEIGRLLNTKKADGMRLQTIVNSRETNENRKNQLDQLEANLAQSVVDLAQLQLNHKRLTLTAPESGKVLNLLYESGEMIPSGAPALILETKRQYVDIYVNENMVTRYLPDTKVSAKVPALKSDISGIVRFATAAPSFADLRTTRERGQADLTSYQVRIYIDDIPHLLTGMTIEVNDAERD